MLAIDLYRFTCQQVDGDSVCADKIGSSKPGAVIHDLSAAMSTQVETDNGGPSMIFADARSLPHGAAPGETGS
jgi:hypothetical protein